MVGGRGTRKEEGWREKEGRERGESDNFSCWVGTRGTNILVSALKTFSVWWKTHTCKTHTVVKMLDLCSGYSEGDNKKYD